MQGAEGLPHQAAHVAGGVLLGVLAAPLPHVVDVLPQPLRPVPVSRVVQGVDLPCTRPGRACAPDRAPAPHVPSGALACTDTVTGMALGNRLFLTKCMPVLANKLVARGCTALPIPPLRRTPPCTLFIVGCPRTRTLAPAVLLCTRSRLQRPKYALAELNFAADVLLLISGKARTLLKGLCQD